MAIQLGGLATGLDTNALIQQLMAVEQRPITLLQTQKVKFQAQSTAFQDLNAKLLALKTKADDLRDPATLLARSATSSDEDVAVASATPGSLRGTFTLAVTQLARGSIAAAATTTAALSDTVASGTGTFAFTLGASGTVVSVPLTSSTTLGDLVKAINEENAGVKASVVNAGTTTTPAWKLSLTSVTTGAANNIIVVTDGTTLGVTNTQTALDAAFSVSGLGDFTRSTNTFSDVLEGVSVTLKGGGATDLVLDVDSGGTRNRLQGLLDAYNNVIRTIDGQSLATKNSDGTLTPGAFTGDVVPRQLRSTLAAAIRSSLPGTIHTLAELGITTQKDDGTLTLDGAAFDRELGEDPAGVTRLLAGTSTQDGVADILSNALDEATRAVTGTIATRQDGITSSVRALDRQIASAQDRLDSTEQVLRAKFTALEQTVSQLQSTGTSLLNQLSQLNSQLGTRTR
jgi:flagellar hook-associated protein 2